MVSTDKCAPLSELRLTSLKLNGRIGWSEEERRTPQGLRFDLVVRFAKVPSACTSDELNDTACYGEMAARLRTLCSDREFKLIERLGHEAHAAVKSVLPVGSSLELSVTKEKPPIPELTGGATFTLRDF